MVGVRPDPRYRWKYLLNRYADSSVWKSIQKCKSIMRCGVPQSDWVVSAWGYPLVATAPPEGVLYND